MANFFSSLFNRPLQVNVYDNTVYDTITFEQLSFAGLEALYSTLADARIIEDWISDNIAKIRVGVFNRRDTEVFNTPLNNLIDQTNATQNWYELIKEIFILYGLTGNIFVQRAEETGYLYTLPTSKVLVQLARDKTLPEYLNFVKGYTLEIGGYEYPLDETSILHMKTASLAAENGLWSLGSSPYHAGRASVDTLLANYSSRISMIKDRGALGVLTNESEVPDQDQTEAVQERLKDYGTLEDQKKYIVTTEKLKWQQMSLGTNELQLLQNLDHDFATLCELRGLDPLLFSSEGSTYANQEQARKAAINNVVVPLANKFYTKFNDWNAPLYSGLRVLPMFEELPEYGEVNTELSSKVLGELRAGILTQEQAFEMLYPDGDFDETLLNIQDDDTNINEG